MIARRYKASTKDNVVVNTVNKYKLINHRNVLRCRGYCVRPSTLFFPFCSVELPNQKEVHNLGEYVDYLNSVSNFERVNRLGLDHIDKHLENKHKELDENQSKMMLKLVQPFIQLPLLPTCSPVKTFLQRNIIIKETCSSVGDVIMGELPSVNIAIDFHATNMEQTGANEFRLKPDNLASPHVELPSDLQSSATCESEHGSPENPESIVELSDADVSFNVSLRSPHVVYDHEVPQRVRKHRYQKMIYPPSCVESWCI